MQKNTKTIGVAGVAVVIGITLYSLHSIFQKGMCGPARENSIDNGYCKATSNAFHNPICMINNGSANSVGRGEDASIKSERLSLEKSLQIAVDYVKKHGRDYDENRPLGISETGDVVRVTFWGKTNPFYNPSESYTCIVTVNTLTGETTKSVSADRNITLLLRLPSKQMELNREEIEEYKKCFVPSLIALDEQAYITGVLPGIPDSRDCAVEPNDAVSVADKVRKLAYDRGKPPHVSLINGVYVVTYWKTPEEIDVAWKRYAYRICIDAQTGEYLGMDYSSSAASKEGEGRPAN